MSSRSYLNVSHAMRSVPGIRFDADASERAPDNFIYPTRVYNSPRRVAPPVSPRHPHGGHLGRAKVQRRISNEEKVLHTFLRSLSLSLSWRLMAATPTANTERLHNLRAGTPKGTIIRGRHDAAPFARKTRSDKVRGSL